MNKEQTALDVSRAIEVDKIMPQQAAQKPMAEQSARFAIEGAIDFGRLGINKPLDGNHWLMPFWQIGQQLAAAPAVAQQEVVQPSRWLVEWTERFGESQSQIFDSAEKANGFVTWNGSGTVTPLYAAPITQQDSQWHDAVLNECMKVESCYVAADPAKSIANLIDWYVRHERSGQQDSRNAGLEAEAKKLAPILREMCEGGGEDKDTDIYAYDYQAGDGDVYVIRAAQLLEEFAAIRALKNEAAPASKEQDNGN